MGETETTEILERLAMGIVAVTARSIAAIEDDLTFPQWRVLVIVGGSENGIAVSEVAERTGSALSPASRVVRRMERRGWVRLSKAAEDRRVTLVHSTPAGTAVRDDVMAKRRIWLTQIVAAAGAFTASDLDVLERLIGALTPFV